MPIRQIKAKLKKLEHFYQEHEISGLILMLGDDVDGDEDGVYDVDDTSSCQKSREVQFRLV